MFGASDDSGENSAGSVLSSKTGLDHAGTVVDDDCLLFTHLIVKKLIDEETSWVDPCLLRLKV